MGIQGLLPFLKKIHNPVNVSKFSGCTVAIDAYCWLHKGAFSCAEKLALGEKTDQYVYYCMKFINMLLAKNIKPVMVFDGCHLPSKKNVEKSRREKRDLNKKKAAQFLREGKRAEARECLQRCIDISPEMALELMNACRNNGVDCIVAPYEADAQLAYLNKIGIADVIITEDSDLLLFGCEKVLFKMDHAGNGVLIEKHRLNEVTDIQTSHYSFERFRYMCILSGCDYLQSLPGIGLARANKVFKTARQGEITLLLKKLSTYLKSNITVPQEYIDGFIAADNTFLYQLVFDPLQRKLVPLNPYPDNIKPDELSYAGSRINDNKALQIALGNINIYTGEMFADFDPDTFVPKYVKKKPDMLYLQSIWNPNYRPRSKAVLKETQVQERPNLKGKEIHVKSSIRKNSPFKRNREIEDSKDVKTDNELQEMYLSPVKKKLKLDDVDDNIHRFMFTDKFDIKGKDEHFEEEKDDKSLQSKPIKSPEFFNSLSHAHPAVKDESGDDDVEDNKENGLTSPRRNVFACKSPSKRGRFNLNAVKQGGTKSRFFGSSKSSESKSSPKKSPKKTEIKAYLIDEYKPVHSNTANVYKNTDGCDKLEDKCETDRINSTPDIKGNKISESDSLHCEMQTDNGDCVTVTELPSLKNFKFSTSKPTSSKSPASSPAGGSAFNWSKFKFNHQNSNHNTSKNSGSSKSLTKPFKRVVSENTLDSLFKRSSKEDNSCTLSKKSSSFEDNILDRVTSPVDIDASQKSSTSYSQCSVDSLPYSIDSDCLRDSDFIASQSCSQVSLQSSQMDIINPENERNSISNNDDDSNFEQTTQSKKSTLLNSKEGNSPDNDIKLHIKDNEEESESRETDNSKECDTVNMADDASNKRSVNDEIVYLIDSDDESTSSSYFKPKKPVIPKSPVFGSKTSAEKGTTKTGCRVSGLSKKSKGKTKTIVDNKQPSLKDMFTKFAHKSRDRSEIKTDSSIEDHSQDVVCTPEGPGSVYGKKTKTQKSLLH